jgi:hypothetical protein
MIASFIGNNPSGGILNRARPALPGTEVHRQTTRILHTRSFTWALREDALYLKILIGFNNVLQDFLGPIITAYKKIKKYFSDLFYWC